MKIRTKKEVFEFYEYFKSLTDLKVFIKENNKFINVDDLEDKIIIVYDELSKMNTSIKSSILSWIVVKQFNFKHTRPNNINFWLERGFGIDEFNEYNKSRYSNNQFNVSVKNGQILPLNSDNENIFHYGNFKFKSFGAPKCNLCKTELELIPSLGRYNINGCINVNCETHKNKEIDSIRQLGFLPLEVYFNKNKRLNISNKLNKEYWLLNGFTYLESLLEIEKIKITLTNINVNTFEYYKLTTDMCDDDIKNIIATPTTVLYWLNKGLTLNEAKFKISELQTENANKFAKLRKDNPNNYSATTHTQLGYWLNKGYVENEAKDKVTKRQKTFSKEICIEKYGEEEGLKIFTERQNKWSKSLITGGNLNIGYSKISQELFKVLLDSYNIEDRNNIYFATHNKEYKLDKCESEGGIWLYDFTDINNKKIIEFHGDMFHGNPKKYKATDYPHPFRKTITAQDMWDKDKRKLSIAIKEGFEMFVIWDSEYRWGNKQEIINKCIAFLSKK